MKLSELPASRFACDCGRWHEVPVRAFAYQSGAVDLLGEVVPQCLETAPVRDVVVVADVRTWTVCGRDAHAVLDSAGSSVSRIIIADTATGSPVCDEATYQTLVEQLRSAAPDLVVAVGSGVVNDLCKWASFSLGLPYVVVATAASMNGYAAANVAARIDGVKVLIEARPPLAVLAEPSVIERAPPEMTAAGFADTLAKYQSNADWVMNHLLLDEYYCAFCAGIVEPLEHVYRDCPEDIREAKPEAVKGLFEALFWTGVAMTLVGTSAPASGGEHLLSHTLDMMADVHGHRHDLHGRQVGLGAILSAALYQRVLVVDRPIPADSPREIDAAFWREPAVTAAVRKQYQAKRDAVDAVRHKIVQPQIWDRLRTSLAARSKHPRTMQRWLRRAGGAVSMSDIGFSREQIRAAILHMHEIRRRFTIVDLAWMLGILPDAADDLIDRWLTGSDR